MIKTKTTAYEVAPINSVEEVRKDYDWVYSWITEKTVPLEPITVSKKVHLVPVDTYVQSGQEEAFFLEKGFKPVEPNYLLGLIKEHPEVFKENPWIVCPSSVFASEDGNRCFLIVYRYDGGRGLDLVRLDGSWDAGRGWVFLCQDLDTDDTQSESLGISDTLTLAIDEVKKGGYKVFKEM